MGPRKKETLKSAKKTRKPVDRTALLAKVQFPPAVPPPSTSTPAAASASPAPSATTSTDQKGETSKRSHLSETAAVELTLSLSFPSVDHDKILGDIVNKHKYLAPLLDHIANNSTGKKNRSTTRIEPTKEEEKEEEANPPTFNWRWIVRSVSFYSHSCLDM